MKKTLSVVLAALLLCTLCVVFAAADEPAASDYVFGVDNVNALAGETTNIYTHGENLNAWAVIILLDKVEDNLYKVSGTPDVGAGDPRNITLADGQILLVVHSSTNDPAQADQYPNCFDKNAAMALTDGMFVQLSGIDLTVDGAVENGTATCTVEDPRTARPKPSPLRPCPPKPNRPKRFPPRLLLPQRLPPKLCPRPKRSLPSRRIPPTQA